MPTLQLFVCLLPTQEPQQWSLGLDIPTAELHHYSLFPLKWVRYLGHTLLGCQGHLSRAINGEPVNYDLSPPDYEELKGKYYYITEGSLFPLDLHALEDRFSDSGASTESSQANFRAAIVERDGECIVTGYEIGLSQASHILPRAKGDEYIQRWSAWRTQGAITIDEICDPRNGFLLDMASHRLFGTGQMAFLRTPNFALQTADVPLAEGSTATAPSSLILQYFVFPSQAAYHDRPHGKIIRQPVDASKIEQWPPAFILDSVYGAAAFKRWSTPGFIAEANTVAYPHYYDKEDVNAKPHAKVVREKRAAKRELRAARRDQGVDAIDIVHALWQLGAMRGAGPSVVKSKTHSEDKDSGQTSNDKVAEWLKTNVS